MENETWNMGHGKYNMEHGIWNMWAQNLTSRLIVGQSSVLSTPHHGNLPETRS